MYIVISYCCYFKTQVPKVSPSSDTHTIKLFNYQDIKPLNYKTMMNICHYHFNKPVYIPRLKTFVI